MNESVSVKRFEKNTRLKEKAKELLDNKEELGKLLKEAYQKVTQEGAFNELIHTIQLFISLVKDYAKGNYRDVPVLNIILIVASLIYVVSPIDIIPDVITGVGYLDDIAILKFVIDKTNNELKKYRLWKENEVIAA